MRTPQLVLTAWVMAGALAISAGCGGRSESPPTVQKDPWYERLKRWEKQYEDSKRVRTDDWHKTVEAIVSEDISADTMAREIADLRRQLETETEVLEKWSDQIAAELRSRGIEY